MIGGLEPLNKSLKDSDFKYTLDNDRINWVKEFYPYSDYFINSIREIPWNEYTYNGLCEYTKMRFDNKTRNSEKDVDEERDIKTEKPPTYVFAGGCVYEILKNKYKNVDLYDYCDPTGDIDVNVYPPKLPSFDEEEDGEPNVYFRLINDNVNSFYRDFLEWLFNNLVENINKFE
jgi:hypothetical protein